MIDSTAVPQRSGQRSQHRTQTQQDTALPTHDIAIIGGGILGLATARALAGRYSVVVLEAEDGFSRHQSGRNSGVIHSGLYYKPGSLKAKNCVAGRDAMYRFCERHEIPFERCGKLVVAAKQAEIPALHELERRGRANGLAGLRRLVPEEIRELEPNVVGVAGLLVPETGIVDYSRVVDALAGEVRAAGGEIRTGARLRAVERNGLGLVAEAAGGEVRCAFLVACAGLQCDRVAGLCGVRTDVRIVPFRGEYWEVREGRRDLVRRPVYPVPDPRFPFLGVHYTPTIDGRLIAGPNAVLALEREGYRSRANVSLKDAAQILGYGGFWRLALKFWKTGVTEVRRSLSRRRFVDALRELVPATRLDDVAPADCGIRAQAVDRAGQLVDDFRFADGERSIHVLNAPSPGATASLSIGAAIAERVARRAADA